MELAPKRESNLLKPRRIKCCLFDCDGDDMSYRSTNCLGHKIYRCKKCKRDTAVIR